MFEKEAKEYVNGEYDFCYYPEDNLSTRINAEHDWQKGAEFGYNKANEWHYTKDELPKVNTWVTGFYYGKDNWHKIFYRADGNWWGEGQLCQPPYAWKEIVLPEIKE